MSEIQQITDMFKLVDTDQGFKGFVVPPSYIGSYGSAALSIVAKVVAAPNDLYVFKGTIASIDDSGVLFFGQPVKREKAHIQMLRFRDFIEDWHPLLPPEFRSLEEWAQHFGLRIEQW